MSEEVYDVIVVGSGPAGATASTLLAMHGHDVLMIERDKHPRFHIGESMLPLSEPVFQRLGIQWDKREYLPKGGAEFIDEQSGQNAFFPLATHFQPYQIERAEFDLLMVNNARKHGVTLRDQESARKLEYDASGVQVTTDKAQYKGHYLVDATGRSAMTGRNNSAIQRIGNLGQFSHYTHYRNVASPAAQDIFKTGNIKILMLDIGWFWVIPLVNRRLSVGIVVQKDLSPAERGPALFEKYLQASPILTELLEGAERETDVRTEADFSFTNSKRFGTRFTCCGDAAGFLDPVFSSGVFMAVTSAARIADRIHQGFVDGTVADPNLHSEDDKDYVLGFYSMRLFVERFYQYDLVHHLFFEAGRNHEVKKDIMGLLSGDLWSDGNNFQKILIEGRQGRNSAVP